MEVGLLEHVQTWRVLALPVCWFLATTFFSVVTQPLLHIWGVIPLALGVFLLLLGCRAPGDAQLLAAAEGSLSPSLGPGAVPEQHM